MSTQNCHSEYDSAGTLTAAPYIPTSSSTKEVYCHTYGTIYTSANLHIKDSCILGNNEGYTVFYEDSSSKQITISMNITDAL
jgi:hypothetical protein